MTALVDVGDILACQKVVVAVEEEVEVAFVEAYL